MKLFFISLLAFVSMSVSAQVLTGIDVLEASGFKELRGKRIGLITNPTGVNRSLRSTIEILSSAEARSAGIELMALYAPEHGVRGDIPAGKVVSNVRDPQSGAMVYSLYGNGMKPTREMLSGIDALIFDIADIGSRSYTFISTLGLAIEAAGQSGIEFIVLDRPNPLGGLKVEGGGVSEGYHSFVSKYNIPYLHGMTVGELAQLYVGEGFLSHNPTLTVIPMQGWSRSDNWAATGLTWVATSPHIPYWETSMLYPITGMIGELSTLNIGVGYTLPFQTFAAEWIGDAESLAQRLNSKGLEGIIFRPIHYTPYYGSGKGKSLHGVQLHVTDFNNATITLIGFHVLEELISLYPERNPLTTATAERLNMFDKVLGGKELRERFAKSGYRLTPEIIEWWLSSSASFETLRQKYLLYI